MPQGTIVCNTDYSSNQIRAVHNALEQARRYGLDFEWWTWFLNGVANGMPPEDAALQALIEWDLL